MARSYGKILASAASDDALNSLPSDAGHLYWRLVGQPKLSLVGSVDYRPAKWVSYASDWTRERVEAAVVVLEERGYVLVDRDTEELLIRSLTRHDGIPVANTKLRKGLWAAWHNLASHTLRKVAVENMPPELFLHPDAPDLAVQMRWSGQTDSPTDYPIGNPNDSVSDSPVSCLLPPSTLGQSDTRSQRISDASKALADAGLDMARSALSSRRATSPTDGNEAGPVVPDPVAVSYLDPAPVLTPQEGEVDGSSTRNG